MLLTPKCFGTINHVVSFSLVICSSFKAAYVALSAWLPTAKTKRSIQLLHQPMLVQRGNTPKEKIQSNWHQVQTQNIKQLVQAQVTSMGMGKSIMISCHTNFPARDPLQGVGLPHHASFRLLQLSPPQPKNASKVVKPKACGALVLMASLPLSLAFPTSPVMYSFPI